MNQIRSFSKKHPQVNFLLIVTFSGLIFEFWSLLINFVWLWINLTEEYGQNQAKELLFWGISSKLSFSHFFAFPCFNLFVLFVFLFICDITRFSMPGLYRLSRKNAAVMPSIDHPPWRQLPCTQGPVGRSLSNGMWCVCCSHGASGALSLSLSLSLSVKEGWSTFGVMAGTWAKF